MNLLKILNILPDNMANSNNQLLREIRFDWNKKEILEILNMPLIDLMWESQTVHRKFNKYDIQLASLFSVKTGGCCLLYTSPSPRDDGVSRMPSSA